MSTIVESAFLFTDIEGSTKLWERNPHAMRAALARHDEILTKAANFHDGRVFKTIPSATLSVWCSPAPTTLSTPPSTRSGRSSPGSLFSG